MNCKTKDISLYCICQWVQWVNHHLGFLSQSSVFWKEHILIHLEKKITRKVNKSYGFISEENNKIFNHKLIWKSTLQHVYLKKRNISITSLKNRTKWKEKKIYPSIKQKRTNRSIFFKEKKHLKAAYHTYSFKLNNLKNIALFKEKKTKISSTTKINKSNK